MRFRLAKLIFVGGLLVWILNAALWLYNPAPLGHDESQYATDTRALLDGEPKRYPYVSIGMTALAAPGVLAGGDERALRALPAIVGVLCLLAAFALARRVTSEETACWLVGVLAGAHSIVKLNAQLLTDFPSAACLFAVLALLITELTRDDGPRYRMVAAAPLCAAAFYLRYGSIVTIAIIGVAALAIGWRAIVRKPKPVLATLGAFVLLLLPHVIAAIAQTGSPFGILLSTTALPGGGVLEYFAVDKPILRYGYLLAPLMVVGLIPLRRDRAALALLGIAVAQMVALGIIIDAQTRYVLVAIALLALLGIDTVRRLAERAPTRVRTLLAATAALAVVATWIISTRAGVTNRANRREALAPTLLAASAIRADARGAPCVVAGPHNTELEWYSRCVLMLQIDPHAPPGASNAPPADRRSYVVYSDTAEPTVGTTIFLAPSLVRVVRFGP